MQGGDESSKLRGGLSRDIEHACRALPSDEIAEHLDKRRERKNLVAACDTSTNHDVCPPSLRSGGELLHHSGLAEASRAFHEHRGHPMFLRDRVQDRAKACEAIVPPISCRLVALVSSTPGFDVMA